MDMDLEKLFPDVCGVIPKFWSGIGSFVKESLKEHWEATAVLEQIKVLCEVRIPKPKERKKEIVYNGKRRRSTSLPRASGYHRAGAGGKYQPAP